jgi:hypothetical protein
MRVQLGQFPRKGRFLGCGVDRNPSLSSPLPHRSLSVAPLIGDQRCYGEAPVSLARDDGGVSAAGAVKCWNRSGLKQRNVPEADNELGLLYLACKSRHATQRVPFLVLAGSFQSGLEQIQHFLIGGLREDLIVAPDRLKVRVGP